MTAAVQTHSPARAARDACETDGSAAASAPLRRRSPPGSLFAAVAVYDSIAAAGDAWALLQSLAPMSPYQRREWIEAWMETEGHLAGMRPLIAVAEDASGRPLCLLPLGLRRSAFLRRAIFLGGRQTNYNMGLFDPRVPWGAQDAACLLREVARAVPGGIDLYLLVNQPVAWMDFSNPLAGLPRSQSSPSFSHRAVLERDGEAFLRAHLSAASRKKLRSKSSYLATLGPLDHRVARTPAEIDAVLSAHLVQKRDKLEALGVAPPEETALRRLLDRACRPGEGTPAPIELHALHCGDRIVATLGGLSHAGRFSGLLISYDQDPPIARASPGELLLAALARTKCAEGFDGFDLGIGEARYKTSYCPIADPLVDTVVPLTARGFGAAVASAARLGAKRRIKRSPWLWGLTQSLRRHRAAWRARAGS